ncbi:MAG: Hsp20/alpha crystallin family protein [Syntrophobacter sp.]
MAAIRWNVRPEANRPGRIVERLHREVNRLFSELSPGRGAEGGGVFPLVNISEDDENLFIRAEMPGIGTDEVELSVTSDRITISGERKVEAEGMLNAHRREREGGHFNRTLQMPVRIDPEKATAVFKCGILKIAVPKAKETEARQVKIQYEE